MKKLFILFTIILLLFTSCVSTNSKEPLVETKIAFINKCNWDLNVTVIPVRTNKPIQRYNHVDYDGVNITIYQGIKTIIDVKGPYDYKEYSIELMPGDVKENEYLWYIDWSTYKKCYTLERLER